MSVSIDLFSHYYLLGAQVLHAFTSCMLTKQCTQWGAVLFKFQLASPAYARKQEAFYFFFSKLWKISLTKAVILLPINKANNCTFVPFNHSFPWTSYAILTVLAIVCSLSGFFEHSYSLFNYLSRVEKLVHNLNHLFSDNQKTSGNHHWHRTESWSTRD